MGLDHTIGNIDAIDEKLPKVSITNINLDNDIHEGGSIVTHEVYQLISEEPEIRVNTDVQNPIISGPIEKIKSSISKLLDLDYLKAKYLIKDQKENAFARKASMTMVEYNRNVIKALKTQGFLSINTEKGELLGKLFNGFTTKKGNVIDGVLTDEDISEAIKSYYRRKGFQAFGKLTSALGIEEKFNKSYNSIGDNNVVFEKLSKSSKPENNISMAQDILLNLSFEERLYLYLLKHNHLGGSTFDLCYKLILSISGTNEIRYGTEFVQFKDIINANIDEQLKELKR